MSNASLKTTGLILSSLNYDFNVKLVEHKVKIILYEDDIMLIQEMLFLHKRVLK